MSTQVVGERERKRRTFRFIAIYFPLVLLLLIYSTITQKLDVYQVKERIKYDMEENRMVLYYINCSSICSTHAAGRHKFVYLLSADVPNVPIILKSINPQ